MDKPKIAGKSPISVDLIKDQTYVWCACGKSSNHPFCDGKHNGSGISPVFFKAEETKTMYLCACKQSNVPHFCDGSHNRI